MSGYDEFEDWLHEVHGHRLCLLQQQIRNGEIKAATHTAGSVTAVARILRVYQQVQDGVVPERNPKDHYAQLSKARLNAEQVEQDASEPDLRGLQ